MIRDSSNHTETVTLVFTDGASEGNPGPGGWAVVCVGPLSDHENHLEGTPETRVIESGAHVTRTTNNRMELSAAIEGVTHAAKLSQKNATIRVYSDSSYVVNGISRWLSSWERRGWKTASGGHVLNRDLWEGLSEAVKGISIKWNLIAGHRGVLGNERADALATAFASGVKPECYNGAFTSYTIRVLELPEASGRGREQARSKKPYSYISFVDGKISRHLNWAGCERVVRGKSSARFRKTFSPEDEARIISDWKGS